MTKIQEIREAMEASRATFCDGGYVTTYDIMETFGYKNRTSAYATLNHSGERNGIIKAGDVLNEHRVFAWAINDVGIPNQYISVPPFVATLESQDFDNPALRIEALKYMLYRDLKMIKKSNMNSIHLTLGNIADLKYFMTQETKTVISSIDINKIADKWTHRKLK